MSDPVSYPIPWDLVFGLWPNMLHRTPASVDSFSAAICARLQPPPIVTGTENLPLSPRFVLAANHFQHPGVWIMHPASVLTQAIRQHYGPGDPPVRWMVTTARSLRRILREASQLNRPLGIFPEGVAGTAGKLTDPIPGVDRLLIHLARHGLPVQPAGISEGQERLIVRFGPTISCAALLAALDAAKLTMQQIARLI
jgi:hypothetical protein